MGADVRLDPAGFDIGIRSSWQDALAEVGGRGGKPYAIPAGASEHPYGGLGFANWAYEVEQQEPDLGVFFDTIVVCTVTGSTHAGMIAGFAGQDRPRRVIGIDASATLDKTRAQVARIARHTADLIGLGRDLRDDEITVLEGWAGDEYGIPVQSTIDAIRLSGELEGMIIDPVYEGKSMAGLIDLVPYGTIATDSTVLYAHLGGQPRSTRTAACSDPDRWSGPGQVRPRFARPWRRAARPARPDVGLQHQPDPGGPSATTSTARLTTAITSSHSPSMLVNIALVSLGRPDARTTRTAAATASVTDPVSSPDIGEMLNATIMSAIVRCRGDRLE